ncbi:hypothetical protein LEMLEM_LOCUS22445 [Lemmus lemmus]
MMTASPSTATQWPKARMASAARWAMLGACTHGRSTGQLGSGVRMLWWAWPRPVPRYTQWVTPHWWAVTPSRGAGTWAAAASTTMARTGLEWHTLLSWGRMRPLLCRIPYWSCWTWTRARSASSWMASTWVWPSVASRARNCTRW